MKFDVLDDPVIFRLRTFTIHLVVSVVVLFLTLAALYAGWYRWPGWYLAGAEVVVGLMVVVDLGLGPLGTLVVSNPAKPRKVWRRDLAFIIAMQLVALGYGTYTLWAGRPLFYAFSLNRIEMVRAADFSEQAVDAARDQGAEIVPNWHHPVRWVWARLPDDPQEQAAIIYSTLFGGDDVVVMPRYFRSWSEGEEALTGALIPLDRLSQFNALSEAEYRARLGDLERDPDDLGMLPVKGNRRDGTWVFDRKSGEPLVFWPVVIWELRETR